MRGHRPRHGELPDERRQKANCRSYTKVMIRRGQIKRLPCEVCGGRAESHHPDYSNPRLVVWLCRSHHLALHANRLLPPPVPAVPFHQGR